MNEQIIGSQAVSDAFAIVNNLPVGTIMPFAGTATQATTLKSRGWLLCNGGSVSQKEFPELHALIGSACGADATNFTLPDTRGMFLRGVDDTAAHTFDPDAGSRTAQGQGSSKGGMPLTRQGDEVTKHNHTITKALKTSAVHRVQSNTDGLFIVFANEENFVSNDVGGHETRPKNVAVSYIIFAGLPQPISLAS